ncbi:MAG: replication-relaxation family protein [Bdellovibrionota bacterium]|nr:replication-relaxation family protein [Bdellovibrionota bacterium]
MAARLTKRDHFLFQALFSYGLLSTTQINQLVFSDVDYRTVLRRLRKLEKLKVIQRVRSCKVGTCVWYLRPIAAKRIGQEPIIKSVNRNLLEHDLLVNDIRLALNGHTSFLQWKSGHYLRHLQGKDQERIGHSDVIPDWITRAVTSEGSKNISLEIELSYKGPRRMLEVFRNYYGSKKSIDSIWYFVPSTNFGKRVALKAKEICDYNGYRDSWFYWCLIDEFLSNPLKTPFYGLEKTKFLSDLVKLPAHNTAHPVGK